MASTETTATRQLAKDIVAALFKNRRGETADELVLICNGTPRRDLGRLSVRGAVRVVEKALQPAVFAAALPGPCSCPVPGPAMSQACADATDGKRGGPRCSCRCHEEARQ